MPLSQAMKKTYYMCLGSAQLRRSSGAWLGALLRPNIPSLVTLRTGSTQMPTAHARPLTRTTRGSVFFLFGIWNLWLQRNCNAFKQQEASPNLVQAMEMQVREFFYCVANQEEIKNKIVKQVRLSKPEIGWPKLNTDGSFGGEGVSSGCGGLLRDSNGLWIRGFAKAMMVSSSLAAEMWAFREGVTLCLDLKT